MDQLNVCSLSFEILELGNYTYEVRKLEAEIGLRIEYVELKYEVDPNHNTYESDGYNYFQPFPNVRLTYKMNDRNRISAFFNRRVDRPDEVDIRIFPKYDDAEIIKVGNPALRPQFTNTVELGYKTSWDMDTPILQRIINLQKGQLRELQQRFRAAI